MIGQAGASIDTVRGVPAKTACTSAWSVVAESCVTTTCPLSASVSAFPLWENLRVVTTATHVPS